MLRRAAPLLLVLLVVAPGGAAAQPADLTLVETVPLETTLDHPDVPDAADVWVAMLAAAQRTIDIGQFYATSAPGSRLEPVIAALEAAAARGVRVRFLTEQKFYAKDPATVDRLAALPGVAVRRIDSARTAGGVMHAKYVLVDGRDVFVGSQNFDWRALTHNFELGVRLQEPAVAAVFGAVFELDWALAEGAERPAAADGPPLPVRLGEGDRAVTVTPVASPKGWLPDERLWDLPRLLALIEGARSRIRVQLMTYTTIDYDGGYWGELDHALRAAAARGVRVELIVADWAQKRGTIESLQSLEPLANVAVRIVTVPQASGAFVPYARVIHAKYMVVDGERAWIGTSNWSRDYFYESRNLGLVVEGASFAARLDGIFRSVWDSAYAQPVDPGRRYEAPRVKE